MFLTTIQSSDIAPSSTHYILLIISQQLSSLKTEKEAMTLSICQAKELGEREHKQPREPHEAGEPRDAKFCNNYQKTQLNCT